jgi:hypothetical protein
MTRAEIILRSWIERIEAKIGPVSIADSRFYGAEALDPETRGSYLLAFAIAMAREALETGDDRQIADEAARCQVLESSADRLFMRSQRREGGATTAAKRRREAEERYKPYQADYQALLDAGVPYLKARQQVLDRMEKRGIAVPSHPVINRRFPKPPILKAH